MAALTVDSIVKRFGTATALGGVSLDVADGEFVALLGPSGCGKTTLLRIIAGLESQDAGRIIVGGVDMSGRSPAQRGLAMVFQNYAVFPHMTVRENIAFGLTMQKRDAATTARQVDKAASLLQITSYLDRYPAKLSGGQRQRVAVARALAIEPPLLLMDEPLSNLDALLRLEMRAELKGVLREAGTTTVYVTHDQTEAMGLADRIAVMHGGAIVQIDTPSQVYARPATQFVGGFVGSPPMNFVPVTASGGRVTLGGISVPAPRDGALVMGFRGEAVELSPEGEGLPFTVRVVEPMGSHALLTGVSDDTPVRVAAPPDCPAKPGERMALRPDVGRLVFLDPQTKTRLDPAHA